jgi:hypothetical protein
MLCRSLEKTCPCTRNPLLHYFVSGEQAILAIAGRVLGEAAAGPDEEQRVLSDVQLAFHYLAQYELQIFCDLCRRNCARAQAGIVTGRRSSLPPLRSRQRILRLQRQYVPAQQPFGLRPPGC